MTHDEIEAKLIGGSLEAQKWALLLKKHDLSPVLEVTEAANLRRAERLVVTAAFGTEDRPPEFDALFRHATGRPDDPAPIPEAIAATLLREAVFVMHILGSANYMLPPHLRTRRPLDEIVRHAADWSARELPVPDDENDLPPFSRIRQWFSKALRA